ncbi:MAG: tRNA (adenosine(37)-N6)-threonylcarbamoyltransferase complex ATPase subunit type 1 TsaE [Magnetococcus sp. DMHC-6]
MNVNWQGVSGSEMQTESIASRLAQVARVGLVVALEGDLGAGKTVFARGFVHGMGVADPYVTSPTFTLLNPYLEGKMPVYHFDFYRLESPEELIQIGAEGYLGTDGVALVEWPSRAGDWIPADHLRVVLTFRDEEPDKRWIEFRATGGHSNMILADFCHLEA